jgi:hypothetical protein
MDLLNLTTKYLITPEVLELEELGLRENKIALLVMPGQLKMEQMKIFLPY